MTSPLLRPSSRRARRRFAALAVGVLALGAASCVPLEPLPPQASQYCLTSPPTSPAHYQQAFDGLRMVWTEWAAADGAVPVDLEDGRTLWLFGDTIVGRVRSDGSIAGGWKIIRNAFVMQQGACFTPFAAGGSRGARTEAVPNPTLGEWYWPTAGVVEDDGAGGKLLRVFMMRMRFEDNGSGGFEFKVLDVRVATFSLPNLALQNVSALPFATTPPSAPMYGEGLVAPGDGYLYLYGHPGKIFVDPAKQYVARRSPPGVVCQSVDCPLPPPLVVVGGGGTWEFYDATTQTWTPSANGATPMFFDDPTDSDPPSQTEGPFDALSVVPYGTGFLAAAKPAGAFSPDVETWSAPTPVGPWTKVGKAIDGLPNDLGGTFTYGGHIVTDPLGGAAMLIWSQNRLPLADVIANSWWYRTFYVTPATGSLPP